MGLRKTAGDIGFTTLTRLLVRLRGLIFIPVISTSLGVAAFGAYSQILAVANLFDLFFGLGLYSGLIKYGQSTDDLADLYFSLICVTIVSCLSVVAIVITFSNTLSNLTLQNSGFASAFAVGSLLILTRSLIRFGRDYYRIDSRMKTFSLIETINAYGLVGGVLFSLYVFNSTLTGVFVAMVSVELVSVLILQILIIREIGFTIPSFHNIGTHIRYSIPVALSSLAGQASSRADRLMIGFFIGANAVGVYSIAYQLAIGISIFLNPIRQTFFPKFSFYFEKEKYEKCKKYLQAGIRYFLIISIPSAGGMYLVGTDISSFLTQNAGSAPTGTLIAVIAVGLLIHGFDRIYGTILDAAKRTKVRSVIQATGAVGNILLNIVLIPSFGIFGAAGATVLTYVMTALLTIRATRIHIGPSFPWITFGKVTFSSVAMVIIATYFFEGSLARVILGSILVYFIILFLEREITIREVRELVR